MKASGILTCCVILFLISGNNLLFPQGRPDSLLQEMNRARGVEKIIQLNRLAEEYLMYSPDISIQYSNQALQMAREANRLSMEAEALKNLGKAYYYTGDYRRAENYYLECIQINEKLQDRIETARIYNNLGVLYRSQGLYDKALEYYGRSLEISKELNVPQEVSRVLNNIGEIYKFKGEYGDARLNYEESYELKRQLGDKPGMANSLNNLGEIFNYWGDYEQSLQYYQQSYTIYTETGDRSGMATSIFNIGLIYKDLKNYDQALKNFRESLKLYSEMGEKRGMGFCLDNLGEVYLQEQEYDQAFQYFMQSLEIAREMGTKDSEANSLKNLGKVLQSQSETDKSLEKFEEALAIYQELGNQKGIAEIYNQMGESYCLKTQYWRAIEFFLKSADISFSLKLPGILVESYSGLYKANYNLGRDRQALGYFLQSVELKDSLTDEAVKKNINELEARYQSEKKEREIELKNAQLARQEVELKQRKLIQYGLIGGIMLMLALAATIYRGYRGKQRANLILSQQKALIEQKNNEITDSIRYAQHIQNAILPGAGFLKQHLNDAFVFYKPKDIVSGDFYWLVQRNSYTYVAAVDSTGHGVPGAFISLLGYNILNTTLKENENASPADMLDGLNKGFSERLLHGSPGEQIKDSMDIALCRIDPENMVLEYAGAFNPLWLLRDGQMNETKADKFPIGSYHGNPDRRYTNHGFPLQRGDRIYLFSDGYADQFGGPEGKKFRFRNMRELLIKTQNVPMHDQYLILEKTMNEWMENEEQIDDMLVIGISI